MAKRKGRFHNQKKKQPKQTHATLNRMRLDIQQGGTGFKGWKLNGDRVELDFDYFKDHFGGNKTNFKKFFKHVLDDKVKLSQKAQDVKRALSMVTASIKQQASAWGKSLASYSLHHVPSMRYADRPTMFRQLRPEIMNVLKNCEKPFQCKWMLRVQCQFKKWDSDDTMTQVLSHKMMTSTTKQQFLDKYETVQEIFEAHIENMDARNGSGWYPSRILKVDLHVYDHNPLSGKSYFPIPGYENAKCGLVNVKNDDNLCFLWSLAAAMQCLNKQEDTTAKNKQSRNTTTRLRATFNKLWKLLTPELQTMIQENGMDDIAFCEMERIFKTSLYVFEMDVDDDQAYEPYQIFQPVATYKRIIVLLKAVKATGEAHFVWVKSPRHFLSRTTHGATNNMNREDVCLKCLKFMPKAQLPSHHCDEEYTTIFKCKRPDKKETLPYMKFHGDRSAIEVPLVIYADFEALNKQVDSTNTSGNTTKISHQTAISYAFLPVPTIINGDNVQYEPKPMQSYCGEDAAEHFLNTLVNYCDSNYWNFIHRHLPMMELTAEEVDEYENADMCSLCQEPGDWEPDAADHVEQDKTKVRHHCHFTGRYQGAAHSGCNFRRSQWPSVTIFFHNLKGYDSHFLVKALKPWHGQIRTLNDNGERIKSLTLGRFINNDEVKRRRYTIRFIDSFAFMTSSLDNLASIAIDFNEDCKDACGHGLVHHLPNTTKYLEAAIPQDLDIITRVEVKKRLLRKGVFPYEWFDNSDKLNLELFNEEGEFALQPQDFHSNLAGKTSQDLVAKAFWCEAICRAMHFKTFREYHDLYLSLDVFLLADLVQNFRKTCLEAENCGQDPAHYYGSPSLVLDSYLKHKEYDLELFDNPDFYRKCRRDGMRGGISYWKTYFTQANNELHHDYDMSKPRSEILDMDATSLYPWAGRQRLPTSHFRHIVEPMEGEAMWRFVNDVLYQWPEERGCYLWVDIHLPLQVEEWERQTPTTFHRYKEAMITHFNGNLHDYQAEYPMLVENKEVPTEWLSDRQRELYVAMNGKHTPTNKLINDLYPKTRYMMHYLSLRQALERGWVITTIHERLEFRQESCLRDFLDTCVNLRAKAKNAVEKKLQKDNMNSLIGKFIENVEKHSDFRIFNKLAQFKKHERRGRLKPNWSILNDDCVLAELHKKEVILNKPIMLGIAVYDISKILMSHLWYFLQDHYGRRVQLLGTDTDSLIFHVQTPSWKDDMQHHNQHSLFAEDHPFYRNSRFDNNTTRKLMDSGINPYIGIFDTGDKHLKSIPGFFKPDHDKIIEACALRAKMYSFLRNVRGEKVWVRSEDGWEQDDLMDVTLENAANLNSDFVKAKKHRDVCKAKGVPSRSVDETYTHANYRSIVLQPFEHTTESISFHNLKSTGHVINQISQTKASLRPVDDKRYTEDGLNSLPHGHYLTSIL